MKLALTVCVALCAALMSCRSSKPDTVVVERDAPAPSTVVIHQDHQHGSSCGHYGHNGRWYLDAGHLHIIE